MSDPNILPSNLRLNSSPGHNNRIAENTYLKGMHVITAYFQNLESWNNKIM
jgi:hypothetical protein